MTEVRGRNRKKIIIPEGYEAGGWWKLMKTIFELAGIPLSNPDLKKKKKVAAAGDIKEVKEVILMNGGGNLCGTPGAKGKRNREVVAAGS